MVRYSVRAWLLALIVCVSTVGVVVNPCMARDIYVATTGSNGDTGGSGDPYETIAYACNVSLSGDVIRVRAGTYNESWITIKGGTEVISEDGVHAAKIYSGTSSAIRLTNDNSGIDGFEIYADWNQGSAGDGLVRLLGSDNVWVKNCLVYDAPYDCDVIKIGATNVLIENCIVYNPAHRTDGSSYQECIDTYGDAPVPDGMTVRGCWIFHTSDRGGDYLIYAKGGSKNVLWENNVFGPAGGYANASTGCGAASPAVFPSCENFIARNNLFLGGGGDGAFGFTGASNAHVYNNVFYDYQGTRCFIQFYSAQPSNSAPQTDRNEDCYVFNNIFMQSNGYPIYQDRGRWTTDVTYIPANFQHDYNLYYLANDGGDVNISLEANSVFDDPELTAPAIPDTVNDTYATVVANFLVPGGSPAVEAGADLSTGAPYYVPDDIQGDSRPANTAYDIGADEYTGVAVNQAPSVDAGDDDNITLPSSATLDGTVSDDGLPDPPAAFTTLWTKVSGPGTVTFGDDEDVDTTASFSVAGVYVLELEADDDALTASDTVTITVASPVPGPATNPSPATGARQIPATGVTLSWTAGSGATSHDVYFGTNSNPGGAEFQGNQPGVTFATGSLARRINYYWRIDEVNAYGTTTGTVWTFKTANK